MRDLHVITDLQYGSTGKGLFAGFLARLKKPDTIVTAWGPNAGHTFIDADGEKHVNIMIPNGVVSDTVKRVLIGPGSMIDPARMLDEMTRYGLIGSLEVRVAIHEHAAVVQPRHLTEELKYGFQIGSTMKGVGAALIEKIRREPQTKGMFTIVAKDALRGTPLEGFVVGVDEYNRLVDESECMLVEGAQGFSLSINQGMYPYVTSRDCTTHQLLSDCGIPLRGNRAWADMNVYGVARTYPIRVANRYLGCIRCNGTGVLSANPPAQPVDRECWTCDGKGREQVGTSGPCYSDQQEIQWSDVGVEPELTTVTKLPRRIFSFSEEQIRQAIRMNGVDYVFLNFCNYCKEDNPGGIPVLNDIIVKIQAAGAIVRWTGWGPKVTDIHWRKREDR